MADKAKHSLEEAICPHSADYSPHRPYHRRRAFPFGAKGSTKEDGRNAGEEEGHLLWTRAMDGRQGACHCAKEEAHPCPCVQPSRPSGGRVLYIQALSI